MAGRENAELFVEFKTGVPMALADTNLSTFMPAGSSAAPGLVPAPPFTPGATLFLREDGTWASATLGTASVTNAMLATMAEATFKGRAAGAGAGAPQDLTASEATAILNIFVSASQGVKGLVPAPTTADNNKVLFATGWGTPGLTKLATVTITNVSSVTVNLSSYTDYTNIILKLWRFTPLTNNDPIYVRFSTTGTTYDTSGYGYAYYYVNPTTTALSIRASSSLAQAEIAFVVGNSVSLGGYTGAIEIINFRGTNVYPKVNHQGGWMDSIATTAAVNANNYANVGGMNRRAAQAILGLQFFCSTSGFATGEIYVYGES